MSRRHLHARSQPRPRAGPYRRACAVGARATCFADWQSALTTADRRSALVAALAAGAGRTGRSCNAVFRPDADACQAARGTGACWGVVAEKYRLILFGRYPYERAVAPGARHACC